MMYAESRQSKRLCGEIPGGHIKTPSGKTAIFQKRGNAYEGIKSKTIIKD